jgi:hypothetical protein
VTRNAATDASRARNRLYAVALGLWVNKRVLVLVGCLLVFTFALAFLQFVHAFRETCVGVFLFRAVPTVLEEECWFPSSEIAVAGADEEEEVATPASDAFSLAASR